MSDNQEEAAYYLRFIHMYIDLATETVLKVFFMLTPKTDIDTFFSSSNVTSKLKDMRHRNLLNKKEYELVTRAHLRPDTFDISLLITLLAHLYPGQLPTPTNGWKFPVDSRDFTIGSDLLRLRNIRNTIIAHQPCAKLEKSKFGRLWGDVENILGRLTRQVDSNYKTTLTEKLNTYATVILDPNDDIYQKYQDELKSWFDEVLDLQKEVEKSSTILEAFNMYFKTKPAKYSRYIRLLFDGGRLVLRGLLKRVLSEHGLTLQVILKDKYSELTSKIEDAELLKQLFLSDYDMTKFNLDTDTWDIAVLACVIISILNDREDSEEDIISDVTTILEARRNYAESALIDVDNERFTTVSGKLLASISYLCSELDPTSRKHCKKVIANFNESQRNENDDDVKYFEKLKCHGSGIKSLIDIYNEKCKKLKECVRAMEENGIPFLKYHILDLKIVTMGNDEERKKVVEDTVAIVWQAALDKSENSSEFSAVRQSLDRILDDVRAIPDVEVGNIERHCILLFLKCKSWQAIFHVVEYFDSPRFKQHLQNVSIELSLLFDENISIQGHLTVECLLEILNYPRDIDDRDHTLSVPIKCSSVRGMREVLRVLGGEQTTNHLNEVADKLSHTKGKISLNVFPDVYGFKGVFDETDSDNSGSGEFSCEEADNALSRGRKLVEQQHIIIDTPSATYEEPQISTEIEARRFEGVDDVVDKANFTENIQLEAPQRDSGDLVFRILNYGDDTNDMSSSIGNLNEHQYFIPVTSAGTAEETPILTKDKDRTLEKEHEVDYENFTESVHLETPEGESGYPLSRIISDGNEKNDLSSRKEKLNEHQQFIPESSSDTAEGTLIFTESKARSFEGVTNAAELVSEKLGCEDEGNAVPPNKGKLDEQFIHESSLATYERATVSNTMNARSYNVTEEITDENNLFENSHQNTQHKDSNISGSGGLSCEEEPDVVSSGKRKLEELAPIIQDRSAISEEITEKNRELEEMRDTFGEENLVKDIYNKTQFEDKAKHLKQVDKIQTKSTNTVLEQTKDFFISSAIFEGTGICLIRNRNLSHDQWVLLSSSLSERKHEITELIIDTVVCTDSVCEGHYLNLSEYLKLQSVSLSSCKNVLLSDINPHLESCEIQSSNYTHKSLLSLASGISRAVDLKMLRLEKLNCMQSGCEGHIIDLSKHDKLQGLTMDISGSLLLSDINPHLQSCEIEGFYCFYTHNILLSLVSGISRAVNLKMLKLCNLNCMQSGCKGHDIDLSKHDKLQTLSGSLLLSDINPHLESLELGSFYSSYSHEILISLASGISRAVHLKMLKLGSLNCSQSACTGHAFDLSKNDKLQSLTIDISGILLLSGVNSHLESCEIEGMYRLYTHEILLSLASSISRAVNLKMLKICKLKCLQSGCEGHAIDLSKHDKLPSPAIDMSGSFLLSDINPHLESLDLRNCILSYSHENLMQLSSGISRALNLRMLKLGKLDCSQSGCKGHVIDLSKHDKLQSFAVYMQGSLRLSDINPHLESLILEDDLCSYSSHEVLISLSLGISRAINLKMLKLCKMNCSQSGCEGHVIDLSKHDKLYDLNLSNSDSLLFAGVNSNVQSCEIQCSCLPHNILLSLSASISRAVNLRMLKLDKLNCSQSGCESHVIDLSKHEELKSLVICRCRKLYIKTSRYAPCIDTLKISECTFSHEQWLSWSSIHILSVISSMNFARNACTSENCKGHSIKLFGEKHNMAVSNMLASYHQHLRIKKKPLNMAKDQKNKNNIKQGMPRTKNQQLKPRFRATLFQSEEEKFPSDVPFDDPLVEHVDSLSVTKSPPMRSFSQVLKTNPEKIIPKTSKIKKGEQKSPHAYRVTSDPNCGSERMYYDTMLEESD